MNEAPLIPDRIGCMNEAPLIPDRVGAVVEVCRDKHNDTDLIRSTYKDMYADIPNTPVIDLGFLRVYESSENNELCTYEIPRHFIETTKTLIDNISKDDIIVLCGPQNSGKSTLCRYLINGILSSRKDVLHLDTDLGQSEFTPCGILSLSHVCSPILSPPYTNRTEFVTSLAQDEHAPSRVTSIAHCIGAVSPSEFLKEYFEAVKSLYRHSKTLSTPLVINCCGWTKGFGVALHADLIRLVKPSHVVNLVTNQKKDLPPIEELLMAPGIDGTPVGDVPTPLVANVPGRNGTNKLGYQLRHIALLHYFSSIIHPPTCEITYPYRIHFSDINVSVDTSDTSSYLPAILNCSVIGLLAANKAQLREIENDIQVVDGIRLCNSSHLAMCLGYGVLRAVDVKKKLFYVNTTLHPAQLENVMIFKHTKIAVPFLKTHSLPTPYISNIAATEILGIGSRTQRSNLKRKYHRVSQ